MYLAGSGIIIPAVKLKPDVLARIEWLGRMNYRRLECRANNDIAGLLKVARAYQAKGMRRTAAAIRLEVKEMRLK